jgi:DNA polymerase-3 subunit delta
MKFYPSQFKNFKAHGLDRFSSALFYGEEESFVNEKVHTFIKEVLKLGLSEITAVEGEKILSKEVFLEDLLGTRMLWGDEKKALWIRNAGERVLPLLESFLDPQNRQSFLVVTTDKYLKPASKMRQYYETQTHLLSMGCFPPTIDEVRTKLITVFQKHKKDINADLLNVLSETFIHNAMVLESEVQKLVDYVGDKSFIESQDIDRCLSIEEVLDYDSLIHAFLAGTPQEMIHFFREQLEEGGASIGLIRSLLMQARRLYALKCLEQEGKSLDQASMMVSPQVFTNQKTKIKDYLDRWSPGALQELLTLLMEAEKECKSFSDLAPFSCERTFIRGMHIRKRLKPS